MKPIDEKRLERTEDFILAFQRAEGKSPTFRQIMKECGHSSLSRVAFDVEVLKERGHFANDSDCPICVPDNLRAGKTKSALIVGRSLLKKFSNLLLEQPTDLKSFDSSLLVILLDSFPSIT